MKTKRLVLSIIAILAFLFPVASVAQTIVFSVQDVEAVPGSEIEINVDVESDVNVFSIRFDLLLPEGLTFIQNEKEDPEDEEEEVFYGTLSSRKPTSCLQKEVLKADNHITFGLVSASRIKKNTGTVVTFRAKVSESLEPGTYEMALSNSEATGADSDLSDCVSLTNGKLTIPTPEPPAPTTYTVNCVAGENGSVTITPEAEGNIYEENTEVTLTAIPNDQCKFVSWSDGNTENPRVITVKEDITISATFEIIDGINGLSSAKAAEVVYDLSGMRVKATDLPKGTYIINGKKVVIK